jgi:hypothetical protein
LMEVSNSRGWHFGRKCAHSLATRALPGSCMSLHPFLKGSAYSLQMLSMDHFLSGS